MSGRTKALAVFASGVIALAAGEYLAGVLTLWLLKLPTPLAAITYWRYMQAIDMPQVAPYVGWIKLAGYVGFGVPLLAWAGLAILVLKPRA